MKAKRCKLCGGERMKTLIKQIVTLLIVVLIGIPAYASYDNDLYVLSHVISGEAEGCSIEMKEAVGSVVLNRVDDPRFPDTITDVVFQTGQYACTWDGHYDRDPSQETINVAVDLLDNGSKLDSSVVWQAEFIQGSGVYKYVTSPWGSVMYFCY